MAPSLFFTARGRLVLMLFLGNISLYLSRANITVAIVYMFPGKDQIKGQLLAAFYVGYAVLQPFGGWLAARYGGKAVLSGAVAVWSVATLLTAAVPTCGAEHLPCADVAVPLIFVFRTAVGLAEGCNYPSQMQLVSVWVPENERSTCWGLLTTGESIGTIIALLVGPPIIHAYGWQSIFIGTGVASLLWLVGFAALASASPTVGAPCGPRVTADERAHILASRPERDPPSSTPWRAFFRSRAYVALISTHICYNWSFYLGLSWVSEFFKEAYGADYSNLGVLSVLPYIVLFIMVGSSGRIADAIESRGWLTTTRLRKAFNSIGMLGSAVGFAGLALVAPTHTVTTPSPGGEYVAAALMTVAIGVGGFAASGGYWGSFVDLSPRHSQVLLAISNAAASLPGVGAGVITGRLLDSTGGNWRLVFALACGTQCLGAVIYLCFGSARRQAFDSLPPPPKDHGVEGPEPEGTRTERPPVTAASTLAEQLLPAASR